MVADTLTLLTVKELAERLRISLATGYALIKQGKIASIRIGSNRGAIRISEADLKQYLLQSVQQVAAPKELTKPVSTRLKHLRLKPK